MGNSDGVRRVGDKVVAGVVDVADDVDEAVDLRDIGNHLDTAIDSVGDFVSDAHDEIKDFANSDEVRRAGKKVVDVANDVRNKVVDVGKGFVGDVGDVGDAIKDI